MARRKREEEHESHDRWLVSYADFMTLLFAFFVVMYALSTVNEGKYRILSNAMVSAFHNAPINVSSTLAGAVLPPVAVLQKTSTAAKAQDEVKQKRRDKMRSVAKDILRVMAPLIEQGKVRVLETSRGVTIEINDSILFSPGQSLLQPALIKAMRSIAEVLVPTDFPITIEGHTDNVPINTAQFPSNWELSAVRATTVLRLFADSGVAADRLTAIGYADTRPVEPNLMADGRARNRRVSILIDALIPEKAQEVDLNAPPDEPGTSPHAQAVPAELAR
jgi:chemotaxis protein MotB